MKQRLFLFLLCLGALLCSLKASAQYYSWGSSPASIRWLQVNGPRGKIVYPDYFGTGAAQVISVMEHHPDHGVRIHLRTGEVSHRAAYPKL